MGAMRNHNDFINKINKEFSSYMLMDILKHIAKQINAEILNIAHQDYEPQGASVTMMIADDVEKSELRNCNDSIVGHLDKSHITSHTYPENHPNSKIASIRFDIEVSTCGNITPLKSLNYILKVFDPNLIIADYRIRGFTRDIKGDMHFMDHSMDSITDHILTNYKDKYETIDINNENERNYHTKMYNKEIDIDHCIIGQLPKESNVHKVSKKLLNDMMKVVVGNG